MAFPFAKAVAGWFTRSQLPPRQTGPALEAASWNRWAGTRTTVTADPSLANTTVRTRARYAVANDPFCSNGKAGWQTGLIGTGATPASTVPDPAARKTITDAWARFVPHADADARTDIYGMQGLAVSALIVDGETLVHMVPGPELHLRVIPIDRLETSLTRSTPDGGQIIAGIEFDRDGQRVAYYLRRDDFSLATIRVPTTDLLHVFRQDQPGQIRGISWFAPVLLTANELAQLLDAALIGQKVSAMMAGFLVDQNQVGSNPFEGTQQGSILTGGLEPGTIKVLPSGFDIKFTSPQQVSTGIDLAKLNLRAIAAGLGLPDFILSGDVSQANYSSLRAGLVAWQRRIEQIQYHVLVPQLLNPIWRRWLVTEILAGRIDAPGFAEDPESWLGVEHYFPPLPWVDPLHDVQAQAELVAQGFKSRRQVVAEMGYSVETLDSELASDRAREEALGLAFGDNTETTRVTKHDGEGRILEFVKRKAR